MADTPMPQGAGTASRWDIRRYAEPRCRTPGTLRLTGPDPAFPSSPKLPSADMDQPGALGGAEHVAGVRESSRFSVHDESALVQLACTGRYQPGVGHVLCPRPDGAHAAGRVRIVGGCCGRTRRSPRAGDLWRVLRGQPDTQRAFHPGKDRHSSAPERAPARTGARRNLLGAALPHTGVTARPAARPLHLTHLQTPLNPSVLDIGLGVASREHASSTRTSLQRRRPYMESFS